MKIRVLGIVFALMVSVTVTLALSTSEKSSITSGGKVTIADSSETAYYEVKSNGIPNHQTDSFPTSYNPNTIQTQNYNYKIPKSPTKASVTSCLPMGPIGISLSGVPFFNPYTANSHNAVEGANAEQFDLCDGHPDNNGRYHYHSAPGCISATSGRDQVVGVAFDGYPIYGKFDANGKELTAGDLDECHGRTVNGQYRYHLTKDFPYILGCFTGNVHSSFASIQSRGNCQKATSDDAGNGGNNGAVSSLCFPLASTVLIVLACILLH